MKPITRRLNTVPVFVTGVWVGVGALCFAVQGARGYMSTDENPHRHQHTIDPQGRYHLEWIVNWAEKQVTFNVTVETQGYVGFGLSDAGKMTGADLVIGGVFPDGEIYFSDRHAVATQVPDEDSQQDWWLEGIWENRTHTSLSFSRDWDTCDPQDYPITMDMVTIIWAYGERDDISYHYRNRGSYSVYLLDPDYSPQLVNRPSGAPLAQDPFNGKEYQAWSINTAVELPQSDAIYWCTIHKAPALSAKHHVVGTNVRFGDPQIESVVDHILMYKCHQPLERNDTDVFSPFVGSRGEQCLNTRNNTLGKIPTQNCTELFMVWARGGREFFHPPHVGIPFGIAPDEYYLVKVLYNRPNLSTGSRVTLTMDVFYTNQLRPNEAGILNVGHTIPRRSPSLLIPPSSIDHDVLGICGTHCTREMLPKLGIHVYAVLLHSHRSGRKMKIHHFRVTRELPWMVAEDNHAYNYQHYRILPEITVLPWDTLALRCTYDNTWTNGTVVGGFSSRQEMCSAFLFYYNKIPAYQECSSEIGSSEARRRFLGFRNITWSNAQMEFLVNDTNHPWFGMTVSHVSDTYANWTLEQRKEIQKWQLQSQHVNWCFPEVYAGGPMGTPETELIPPRPKRQKQPSVSLGRKRKRRQLSPTQVPKYEPEWEDPRRYSHFPTNIRPYKPPKRSCSN